jgi:type IV pilus assembly protein PilY1
MKRRFRINSIKFALCLAFPALSASALAQDAYPAIPPIFSTTVAPNIMLYIDTSGSMLQDVNNNWMLTGLCNSNSTNWNLCVDNNVNYYRTKIDAEPNTKMNIAKRVAKNIINSNRNLNFGLFSFYDKPNSTGSDSYERVQAGVLRRAVGPVARDSDRNALVTAIDGIYGRTGTPLAEGLLEITRYYGGQSSLYGRVTGKYTSPIKYRCQKNFTIVLTDGDATGDQNLPGTGLSGEDGNSAISALAYTSRNDTGKAADQNFSVCRGIGVPAGADNGGNVTCLANYESDGTPRDFATPGPNYASALRDVAMYGNRVDLRVGGTDEDKKSFDDPRFARQNMITYAISFSIGTATAEARRAHKVLESTAMVGGGKYYDANSEAQLTAALTDAVSSIGNIVSNAGGSAANGSALSTANKMFQPIFHVAGWYGELLCKKLDAKGNETGPCTPHGGAVFPVPGNRNIASAKVVGGATTPFVFSESGKSSMTPEQQNALGADASKQNNVIKFIRGENISGFRARPNGLLGDITDSQPLAIGIPGGQTADSGYAEFKKANNTRAMVFIGANDGMLHGFGADDMTEIFAFVPSPVYPKLKVLTATDYGGDLNPHAYHVNGALRQQDLKLDGVWTTLLVGGLAQGGQGYFALDATSPKTLEKPETAVKWEFTDKSDADLGYTFGAPIIYNVRTSDKDAAPVVLLANGYKSNYADDAVGADKPTLFIVNANDGSVRKKIVAPSDKGLSSPAGVDFPFDGVLDYVYAGDQSGRLWRFDLTSPIGAVSEPHLVFVAGDGHPIIQRPVIKVVKDKNGQFIGNLVIFGAGSLLEGADRLDNTTQTMYGVLDKLDNTTINRGNLAQRFVEEVTVSAGGVQKAGVYRRVHGEMLDLTDSHNTQSGWFLDLPDSSERLAATPYLFTDRVLFGTGIPNTQEMCAIGYGWLMGLDPLTGLAVQGARGGDMAFYDVVEDGKSNDSDKVSFGSSKYHISGIKLNGIPTELMVVFKSITYASAVADNPFASALANIAIQDSNASGVFDGVSVPQAKSAKVVPCLKGSVDCEDGNPPGEASGIKIETSTWREIRQ